MNEKYYYCYSSNNELLGESAKKYLKNIKHDKQLHDFTSIVSKFLVISSILIDNGSKSINLKIDEPTFKNVKLAETLYFNLTLNPVKELSHDSIDDSLEFKKITNKLDSEDFSLVDNATYGQILKYTSFINLENVEVNNKKDFDKNISSFVVQLFYYIKLGNIDRDFKIQLPIGKELFNIKINCTVKY
jgi:hypothetical protein